MKIFLVVLNQRLKEDYPDIEFHFYLSRRSKFVHMGLDLPLMSITNYHKLVDFIQNYWEENNEDDTFSFCTPRQVASKTYKFDYILFEKKII